MALKIKNPLGLFYANFQRAAHRFEEDLNHPRLKDTIFLSERSWTLIQTSNLG